MGPTNDSAVAFGLLFLVALAFLYLGLCWLVGVAAQNRGRSAFSFILLSLFIFPIFSYLLLILLASDSRAEDIRSGRIVRCPYCSGWIEVSAPRCHYCGVSLEPGWTARVRPQPKTNLWIALGSIAASLMFFFLSFLFALHFSKRRKEPTLSPNEERRAAPARSESGRVSDERGIKKRGRSKTADRLGAESAIPSGSEKSVPSSAMSSEVPAKQIELEVRSLRDCAVQLFSDGDLAWMGTMKSGQVHTVLGTSKVSLWVDDASALSVVFNGEPQPALGAKGQTVHRTFEASKRK